MDRLSLEAERIERAALAELHAAAPGPIRERLGMHAEEVGGALVSIVRGDSSTILNRALGLGVERPATRDDVRRIMEAFAAREVSRYYVHLHPQSRPETLRDWFLEAGLRKGRGWMKFHRTVDGRGHRAGERTADEAGRTGSSLSVRPIGKEHAGAFGRILAPAFDLPGDAALVLGALAGRPGWHLFMSFDGEEAAGTGALYVRGEFGWLDWGSTHPNHRRKGGQGAVLSARIDAAARLGCRHLFTETGEASAGDPQHSYRNILKHGFKEALLRENYVPEG